MYQRYAKILIVRHFALYMNDYTQVPKARCRPRWFSWMRRPYGDQALAGSTPAEVGNIFFYGHSLPSADSRRAVVSFWRKNVHNTG